MIVIAFVNQIQSVISNFSFSACSFMWEDYVIKIKYRFRLTATHQSFLQTARDFLNIIKLLN